MVSSEQDVTAVIVNYGNRTDCAELAGELEAQVHKILIVDNSGDIEPDDKRFSASKIITPQSNIGYGAAVNLVVAEINSRWLLILNPDVRLKQGCLQLLLDSSQQLNAPLCGPRFYWDDACTVQLPPALGHPLWLLSDRHIPNTSLSENTELSTLAIARHERFWNEAAPFSEAVLSGACLLVDLHWFQQNKMIIFDEDFFLYYEDTDLCGRLMRKGVMPVCVADAYAIHYWNQSAEPPESKAKMMQASEKNFLQKYYPNGAPPLPQTTFDREFTELGSFNTSPALKLPDHTKYLDIGVQKDFIVFARAVINKPDFTFSSALWQRIQNGSYYFRAIEDAGKELQFWHWEKVAEQETAP